MTNVDQLLSDAKQRMRKCVDSTRSEFMSVRTGRANPSILDRVMVSYYGTSTPLKQLASVGAPEARLLTVTPYDPSAIKDVESAIRESDLGLNPANDGATIRLPVPELTEDRRRDLVKVVKSQAEDGRVAVRNVRRDVMQGLKSLKSDGDIGEDDERRAEGALQKITDGFVKEIDEALSAKEAEIMEV